MNLTGRLFAAVVVLGLATAAGAVELPDAAREADRYAAGLAKEDAPPAAAVPELLTAARAAIRESNWEEALAKLEEAAVAAPEDFATWQLLSQTWLATKPKSPNTLASAYRAYRLAADNERKAAALATLGSALAEAGRAAEGLKAIDEGLAFKIAKPARQPLEHALEKYRFQATGLKVITDADRPEICIEYRRPVQTTRSAHIEDYVAIQPKIQTTVRGRDRTLCLDGVEFGKTYTVTVRDGFPAADGTKTRSAENFEAKIGDRAPNVAFKGGTYVLPRVGSTGLPVMTVNVEAVHLRVLRINERNLIHELNNDRFPHLIDSYSANAIAENEGRLVWSGDMEVAGEKNVRTTTSFDVAAALKNTKPGVYIVVAEPIGHDAKEWENRATQWLVISDLGLSTFRGGDGLNVFARSLTSGAALPGATLRLYARDNDLLAEAVADAGGRAHFEAGLLRGEGGRRPKALYAESKDGDFSFLDLDSAPFDLSDRGVGGRAAPGPLDVFLYGDRGVYRRGETAHVVALLRDSAAKAADGLPLTVKILRPDGMEVQRTVASSRGPGIFTSDVRFSETAKTGNWTVQAFIDADAQPIGSLSLLVEDVIPPRIEVRVTTAAKTAAPGDKMTFDVAADYLYGAPARGLASEAELVVLEDEAPYPAFPDYAFGLVEESVRPVRTPVVTKATDAQGRIRIETPLAGVPDVSRPLKAVLRAGVFESGGRPATATVTLPIRQSETAIGIRPQFAKGAVAEGGEAAFDVIVLGRDNGRRAGSLKYTFIREEWDYRWYLRDGAWDYDVNVVDKPLGGGVLNVGAEVPARVATATEWGRYRLEVFDPKTGAATSVRFRAGWFVAPTAGDTPDLLEVVADKESYRPGDTVRVHVRAPFAGEALIVVANEEVIETRNVPLPAEGATVDMVYSERWGVGAYLLATAFRPDAEARGPGRAIGLTWLGLDPAPRTLAVKFDVPKQIRPRTHVDVPVRVEGLAPGQKALLTLAAVDEGVLQLTRFQTPDPARHYFGKRRLGVGIRDLYGRLIDGKAGRRGHVRSGGGDPRLSGGAGAPPVDVAITALFSGVVEVGADGKAVIPLDVPDYNGRLRLMAVASSAEAVGSGEDAIVVRDPVIAQASTPRFLAPGDASRITVDVRNLDGADATYAVEVSVEGAVALNGTKRHEKKLAPGEETVAAFAIEARDVGTAMLKLTLSGPDGVIVERTRFLAVRPAQFPAYRRIAKRMAPNENVTYGSRLIEEFQSGTADVFLSFSPRPSLDVAGVLRALDRYPYGCLEQTTSRAMAMLYASEIAALWGGEGAGERARQAVRGAVSRVLEMQRSDGAFGLWSAASAAEPWLSAYAMDFLARARGNQMAVPDVAFRNGVAWLKRFTRENASAQPTDLASKAYAFYVLALVGEGDAGEVRRFMEAHVDAMPSALAAAQVGTALALHGEQDRARTMIGKSQPARVNRLDVRDYGSALRDMAGVIAVTAGASRVVDKVLRDWAGKTLENLVEDLSAAVTRTRNLSPQEMAWIILAADTLSEAGKSMTLTVNGAPLPPRSESFRVHPDKTALARNLTYANSGTTPVWHLASVTGIPTAEEPAQSDGFTIARKYLDLNGEPVELDAVRQNDLLVAVIEGEAKTEFDHQALVVDLLPAGFEVENARLADRRDTSTFAWLPQLSEVQHAEYRDDRFLAAFDLDKDTRTFTLAYLVRAVTPGVYRLPAVLVEDMYKPQFRARSEMGKVTVQSR